MITQARLEELLDYDPETGVWTWRVNRGPCKAGDVAGGPDKNGYICIMVDRKYYLTHRLAFLYMTGQWPAKEVDHINGVKDDNRWENLREATRSQNLANAGVQRNNKLGVKGVSPFRNRYRAVINKNGKQRHLGNFDTVEDASAAYAQAAEKMYGEFARV